MCGEFVSEPLLQVELAYVHSEPLFHVFLLGGGSAVEDGRLGGIHGPVSSVLEFHAEDVLVRLHIGGESCAHVPEGYQFPRLGVLEGYVVVHPPHQLYGESHRGPGGVGGNRVSSHHPHVGIL